MDVAPACPRHVFERDARVLVGLLAVVEVASLSAQLPPALADRLSRRFVAEGLLSEGASDREFRQAVNDLTHQLRYALGEYEQPPEPVLVP